MASLQISQFKKTLESTTGISLRACEQRNESELWLECAPHALPEFAQALSQIAPFDCAFATPNGSRQKFKVHYIFRAKSIGSFCILWATASQFDSVSQKIPAALWDERKIQDVAGIKFNGIPNSRPILSHLLEEDKRVKPEEFHESAHAGEFEAHGSKEGEFEIPVGPVHAGIIEPGHFRFTVAGEDVIRMETTMFFLHRGIERAIEGKSPSSAIPIVEQISGDESVANSLAFVQAIEKIFGLRVPKRALQIRAMLLELERACCHLADLGGMATDVAFYSASSRFMAMRESQMRLNARLTKSRFLRTAIAIGGVSKDLGEKEISDLLASLGELSKNLLDAEAVCYTSSTFLDRVYTTGILRKADAEELAIVGPPARASGVPCDLRKHFPFSAYAEIKINEPLASTGDVLSRFKVKMSETKESIRIIRLLAKSLKAGELLAKQSAQKDGKAVSWCEGARGACTMFAELERGKVKRFACKTPSFRNWRGLERAISGNIMADFPLVNKSFNLSYAGCDL